MREQLSEGRLVNRERDRETERKAVRFSVRPTKEVNKFGEAPHRSQAVSTPYYTTTGLAQIMPSWPLLKLASLVVGSSGGQSAIDVFSFDLCGFRYLPYTQYLYFEK